jgi:hypothetical protein
MDSQVKESTSSSSFADAALQAIPRPVLGVFGILFGLIIFLIFGGFNSSLNRVVNAYASRIERSVESLERVVIRLDSQDAKILELDKRLLVVEQENKRYHK